MASTFRQGEKGIDFGDECCLIGILFFIAYLSSHAAYNFFQSIIINTTRISSTSSSPPSQQPLYDRCHDSVKSIVLWLFVLLPSLSFIMPKTITPPIITSICTLRHNFNRLDALHCHTIQKLIIIILHTPPPPP